MKKTYREITYAELEQILKKKGFKDKNQQFIDFARKHFPKAAKVKFKILSEYNDENYENKLGAVIPLDSSGKYIDPEGTNYVDKLYELIEGNNEPMEDIEVSLSEQSTGLYILE